MYLVFFVFALIINNSNLVQSTNNSSKYFSTSLATSKSLSLTESSNLSSSIQKVPPATSTKFLPGGPQKSEGISGDRTVQISLGWSLEIKCKIERDDIKWCKYNDASKCTDLSVNADEEGLQFYVPTKNILFIPVARQQFENNTVFKCYSGSDAESIKVVVRGCEVNPCKSGKCVLVNEESGIPIVACECADNVQGEFCDSTPSNTPIWVLMCLGAFISLCLIIIAVLVMKKRKNADIIRKLGGTMEKSRKSVRQTKSTKIS